MREFFFSQVLGKECDLNKAIMRKSHTNEALMERNLMSKLLYYSLVSYEETETDTENYENNPLVPTESHSHVKGGLTSESILISFISSTKGQLISKCLFGVFNFFKKRTKKVNLRYHSSKVDFFVRFLREFTKKRLFVV